MKLSASVSPPATLSARSEGPAMCEIFIDEAVPFAPKLGAKQHPDGGICRQFREVNGSECYSRFDPAGSGLSVR